MMNNNKLLVAAVVLLAVIAVLIFVQYIQQWREDRAYAAAAGYVRAAQLVAPEVGFLAVLDCEPLSQEDYDAWFTNSRKAIAAIDRFEALVGAGHHAAKELSRRLQIEMVGVGKKVEACTQAVAELDRSEDERVQTAARRRRVREAQEKAKKGLATLSRMGKEITYVAREEGCVVSDSALEQRYYSQYHDLAKAARVGLTGKAFSLQVVDELRTSDNVVGRKQHTCAQKIIKHRADAARRRLVATTELADGIKYVVRDDDCVAADEGLERKYYTEFRSLEKLANSRELDKETSLDIRGSLADLSNSLVDKRLACMESAVAATRQ